MQQFCDLMNKDAHLSFNPPMISRIERGMELPDQRHGTALHQWVLQRLPGTEVPEARHSDPDTSHDAAESVKEYTISGVREWWLQHLKPYRDSIMMQTRLWSSDVEYVGWHCTDEGAWSKYQKVGPIPCSASGFRTRRAELVHMGLVEDSGDRIPLTTGRKAIAWRITPLGMEALDEGA